jgi:hypothetical protein
VSIAKKKKKKKNTEVSGSFCDGEKEAQVT